MNTIFLALAAITIAFVGALIYRSIVEGDDTVEAVIEAFMTAGAVAMISVPVGFVLAMFIPLTGGEEVVDTKTTAIEKVQGEDWYTDMGDGHFSYFGKVDDGYRQFDTRKFQEVILIRGAERPRVEEDYCDLVLRNWGFGDYDECTIRLYVP